MYRKDSGISVSDYVAVRGRVAAATWSVVVRVSPFLERSQRDCAPALREREVALEAHAEQHVIADGVTADTPSHPFQPERADAQVVEPPACGLARPGVAATAPSISRTALFSCRRTLAFVAVHSLYLRDR